MQKEQTDARREAWQKEHLEALADAPDVITIKDLYKVYRLYHKPSDRLKDSLGLSRRPNYKEHYALKGVSLSVKKGESVGIIGTNGSGKSTQIELIKNTLSKISIDKALKEDGKEEEIGKFQGIFKGPSILISTSQDPV